MPARYLWNGLPRVNARLRIDYRRDVRWSWIILGPANGTEPIAWRYGRI
jgi:hypothetical protein